VIAWLQPWKSRPARPADDAAPAKPATANDPVAQALDDLRQPNSQRRREACGKLAQMELKEQRHDVAQQVEAILNDADGNTRAAAAKTLAVIGGAENVQGLLAQLAKDDYVAARREQLLALGKLKDDRAIEPVAQHLSQNADREAAGQALEAMGTMAEKKVRDYLHYPDVAVRVEACRILQHIGGAASVAALETAKNDVSEKVAKAAADALQAIKGK
jgi:HEAT repeat protein